MQMPAGHDPAGFADLCRRGVVRLEGQMGLGRLLPLAVVALGVMTRGARADGVCVAIDTARDNLGEPERAAVRIAIADALEREGVATDRDTGQCAGMVTAYSVRIDRVVTATIIAGDRNVSGKASSIDELDLLVRQLVRSLVTGRAFATGTGVQDRENVLRDQTAPRRSNALEREWVPTMGLGGGMLQLPPVADQPQQRQYNVFVIDLREWSFSPNGRHAFELRGRLVLHDYAVFGTAWDAFDNVPDDAQHTSEKAGRAFALMLSPFGVGNWEAGVGFATHLGNANPRPYLRVGTSLSLLARFSDANHYFDAGIGAYAGLGFQLTKHAALSVEANIARPIVHSFTSSGYGYFLTTTAAIEIRGDSRQQKLSLIAPEPVPTVRRINE
jgi:hypothetical protein